jgi:ABC-type nitrate/sulfonate/bicarbonate transport system ATPase subunit
VTHDIEEAVHLADRVVVLSERPARVCGEVSLALARPRDTGHPLLQSARSYILKQLGLHREPRGAAELATEAAEPHRGGVKVAAAHYC